MAQAEFAAEFAESALAIGHGTRVAPDDGIAQRLQLFVYTHQTVHLVGDADGLHLLAGGTSLGHDLAQRLLQILPPVFGVLLCPSGLDSLDGGFTFRIERRGGTLSALHVD